MFVKIITVSLTSLPMIYMSKAFLQIFQYVKDQTWTDYYAMHLGNRRVTNRFRGIDFSVDIVVTFILYGEIISRMKWGEAFINDAVCILALVFFVTEKIARYVILKWQ